jgi:tRNA threonylcarbamoyladenosine biosynthesis protein TsaE
LAYEIWTNRSAETFSLGQAIGEVLEPGDIICLYGDLGTGKTVLTQGIGHGLGVKELIDSPTFTLINQYLGRIILYHLDLYRLEDSRELEQLGWEEFLYGDGASVVEWAEKLENQLPANYLKISLEKVWPETGEARRIRLEGIGEMGNELLQRILVNQKG